MAKSNQGAAGLALVGLLLAASVAGAWNYRRNLEAEQAANPRPYRGYSDAELEQLSAAYRADVAQWQERWIASRAQGGGVRERAHLDERIEEFERTQQVGARQRALGEELSQRQAELARLEAEQQKRAAREDELALHLRRLFSF
ncbi:MAG: hypothetical protein ABFS46_03625 [Myxococcota bacterium]